MDTTRPDHFGCYGNTWISTPSVDALAKESILFRNCLTAATTTLASHTSLFTGNYPHRHGVPRNGFIVNADNAMLAELLGDAGFECAGFIGSFVLEQRFEFAQGFKHYDQDFTRTIHWQDGKRTEERGATDVTNSVLEYVDECDKSQRQFLFIHYFDPHAPYDPPPPYGTMYGDGDIPGKMAVTSHPTTAYGEQKPDMRRLFYKYAGEVSFMDAEIGRLLKGLRAADILDNAILVLVSDHGENLCDGHGLAINHGWTVYDTEANIVCIIRLPKGELGGAVCEGVISNTDIMPTLAAYLGLPLTSRVDGEAMDLAHLDQLSTNRTRFAEATKPWENVEAGAVWLNARKAHCVRRGPLKYINTPYLDTEELYDLSSDPHELHNLIADSARANDVGALRAALRDWSASAAPLPMRFESAQKSDTMRRLRSLGYLSGDPNDDDGN
ncbi:MAG: sulfatase [Phycisphaerae bacterium]|nr:sulfatase [Phycisphaerae bacterium]